MTRQELAEELRKHLQSEYRGGLAAPLEEIVVDRNTETQFEFITIGVDGNPKTLFVAVADEG